MITSSRLFGLGTLGCVWVVLDGCAIGSIREARVGGLGRYPNTLTIAVQPNPLHPSAMDSMVVAAANRAVGAGQSVDSSVTPGPHFTLLVNVKATEPLGATAAPLGMALSAARSFTGLTGIGSAGAEAGRLEVEGNLFAPDGRDVGYIRCRRSLRENSS